MTLDQALREFVIPFDTPPEKMDEAREKIYAKVPPQLASDLATSEIARVLVMKLLTLHMDHVESLNPEDPADVERVFSQTMGLMMGFFAQGIVVGQMMNQSNRGSIFTGIFPKGAQA